MPPAGDLLARTGIQKRVHHAAPGSAAAHAHEVDADARSLRSAVSRTRSSKATSALILKRSASSTSSAAPAAGELQEPPEPLSAPPPSSTGGSAAYYTSPGQVLAVASQSAGGRSPHRQPKGRLRPRTALAASAPPHAASAALAAPASPPRHAPVLMRQPAKPLPRPTSLAPREVPSTSPPTSAWDGALGHATGAAAAQPECGAHALEGREAAGHPPPPHHPHSAGPFNMEVPRELPADEGPPARAAPHPALSLVRHEGGAAPGSDDAPAKPPAAAAAPHPHGGRPPSPLGLPATRATGGHSAAEPQGTQPSPPEQQSQVQVPRLNLAAPPQQRPSTAQHQAGAGAPPHPLAASAAWGGLLAPGGLLGSILAGVQGQRMGPSALLHQQQQAAALGSARGSHAAEQPRGETASRGGRGARAGQPPAVSLSALPTPHARCVQEAQVAIAAPSRHARHGNAQVRPSCPRTPHPGRCRFAEIHQGLGRLGRRQAALASRAAAHAHQQPHAAMAAAAHHADPSGCAPACICLQALRPLRHQGGQDHAGACCACAGLVGPPRLRPGSWPSGRRPGAPRSRASTWC